MNASAATLMTAKNLDVHSANLYELVLSGEWSGDRASGVTRSRLCLWLYYVYKGHNFPSFIHQRMKRDTNLPTNHQPLHTAQILRRADMAIGAQ